MPEMRLTKSQKALLNIIKKLGKLLYGRKQLMKLMFLLEHYDLERNKLTKENFLGIDFIIYHYGVFSFDVMNDYISLNKRGILTDFPRLKTKKIELFIDEEIESKINEIISKFGKKRGYELEEETLGMLGLTKETKMKYFGKNVKEIIKN